MLDSQKVDQDQYTDHEVPMTSDSDLPSCSSSASDISVSKSGVPCGGIKSDAPSSSSCVSKVQNSQSSLMDCIVNQGGNLGTEGDSIKQTQSKSSEQECLKLPKKTTSLGDENLKDDDEHEKTLTALSPEAFRCLKPQTEQSGGCKAGKDCDNLATDFFNKMNISGVPKSPTGLSKRIPPELTDTLKLDMNQDMHKSAFKKVGKRFKMSHVPEESLKLASTNVAATTTENVSEGLNTEKSDAAINQHLPETVEKPIETAQYTSHGKLEKTENKKWKVKSPMDCNVSANETDLDKRE